MNIFGRILEKLFNLEQRPECESCAYFRALFEQELMRSERLVESLAKLGLRESSPPSPIPQSAFQPVPSKYTPWSVLRQQLESADRKKFLEEQQRAEAKIQVPKIDKDAEKRIETLEKELDLEEEDSDASKVG
jgi:hypothetical protein